MVRWGQGCQVIRDVMKSNVSEVSVLTCGQKCLSGQGCEVVKSVRVVRAAKWSNVAEWSEMSGGRNGKMGSGL